MIRRPTPVRPGSQPGRRPSTATRLTVVCLWCDPAGMPFPLAGPVTRQLLYHREGVREGASHSGIHLHVQCGFVWRSATASVDDLRPAPARLSGLSYALGPALWRRHIYTLSGICPPHLVRRYGSTYLLRDTFAVAGMPGGPSDSSEWTSCHPTSDSFHTVLSPGPLGVAFHSTRDLNVALLHALHS